MAALKFEMDQEDLRPGVELSKVIIPAALNERIEAFRQVHRNSNNQESSRSWVITKFLDAVVPKLKASSKAEKQIESASAAGA